MTQVFTALSASLDGFIAGPDDDPAQPLDKGGTRLFDWYSDGDTPSRYYESFKLSASSAEAFDAMAGRVGAVTSGRRTYDISSAWRGTCPLPGAAAGGGARQPDGLRRRPAVPAGRAAGRDPDSPDPGAAWRRRAAARSHRRELRAAGTLAGSGRTRRDASALPRGQVTRAAWRSPHWRMRARTRVMSSSPCWRNIWVTVSQAVPSVARGPASAELSASRSAARPSSSDRLRLSTRPSVYRATVAPGGRLIWVTWKDSAPRPRGSPGGRSSTRVAPPGSTSTGGRCPAWAATHELPDGSMTV